MKKHFWILLVCLALVLSGCKETTTSTNIETESNQSAGNSTPESLRDTEPETPSKEPEKKPLYTTNLPGVGSDAYCVINEDGEIVLGQDAYTTYAPASITKVLTALVTAEHAALDEKVAVSYNALQEVDVMSSGIFPSMKEGEVYTVEELLYMLILPSTNAAGSVLAEYVAGSTEAFAALMNEKVAELGLSHSHFMNAHGLDQDGHYTCAYDMAVILKAACEKDSLRTILGTHAYTVQATDYNPARTVVMGHPMLSGSMSVEGVFAGKTGGTLDAGRTLLTAVSRNGETYYICTLHCMENNTGEDTRNLIERAYAGADGNPSYMSSFGQVQLEKVTGKQTEISLSLLNMAEVDCLKVVYWNHLEGTSGAKTFYPADVREKTTIVLDTSIAEVYTVQIYIVLKNGQEKGTQFVFLANGGVPEEGILSFKDKEYCVLDNGFIAAGVIETKRGCYYANVDGEIQYGFVGGRWFAGKDGKIVTGWFVDNYETYYAGADGRIVTGAAIIDGKEYTFTDYGALRSK